MVFGLPGRHGGLVSVLVAALLTEERKHDFDHVLTPNLNMMALSVPEVELRHSRVHHSSIAQVNWKLAYGLMIL